MRPRLVFTHKAWFGWCPVYLADPHTEAPSITPRWPWANALLRGWAAACDVVEAAMRRRDPNAMLKIRMWHVREMRRPVVIERDPDA